MTPTDQTSQALPYLIQLSKTRHSFDIFTFVQRAQAPLALHNRECTLQTAVPLSPPGDSDVNQFQLLGRCFYRLFGKTKVSKF